MLILIAVRWINRSFSIYKYSSSTSFQRAKSIQTCRLCCFSRCNLPRKKTFATYCSSRNAALGANTFRMKYESNPINEKKVKNLISIVETTKEISEREISDLSDNSIAIEYNGEADLVVSMSQESPMKSLTGVQESITVSTKNYTCDYCQHTFKRKYHFMRHLESCKERLSTNEEHLSTTQCIKVVKEKNDNTIEQNYLYQTKDNAKSKSDEESQYCDQARNNTKQRSKIYSCKYCEYTAEKRKLLNVHSTESHVGFSKRSQKPFVHTEMVLRAKMEHDGKVYYHCDECGKNLNSPYTFYWHIRIHTGERIFTCHLCGKRFRVNQGLARHLRETHDGIKNIPCDLCGRMFSTRRNAEDHRRIHTGERPYVCNVCGKTFKQKASLFVHNRTHSDVFPFKCSYCEQTFRTRPPLMVHITKHTGEKPYACDICGRCFRIKYELKRHRLIHSDEKPWRCTECDLSFRQKRYLVNHKKLNHDPARCLVAAK